MPTNMSTVQMLALLCLLPLCSWAAPISTKDGAELPDLVEAVGFGQDDKFPVPSKFVVYEHPASMENLEPLPAVPLEDSAQAPVQAAKSTDESAKDVSVDTISADPLPETVEKPDKSDKSTKVEVSSASTAVEKTQAAPETPQTAPETPKPAKESDGVKTEADEQPELPDMTELDSPFTEESPVESADESADETKVQNNNNEKKEEKPSEKTEDVSDADSSEELPADVQQPEPAPKQEQPDQLDEVLENLKHGADPEQIQELEALRRMKEQAPKRDFLQAFDQTLSRLGGKARVSAEKT